MSRVHDLDPQAREQVMNRIAASLAGRLDVAFATVFGSFHENRPFHDIDVAVWTADSAAAELDLELAGSLSRLVGFPVDVRRINDAPVPFLFHALRGRVVAARWAEKLADLMERTARDYHDRAPLLRRATREAFSA
jgi:predicted nucleotidyltransferase